MEIKPCPFCGHHATIRRTKKEYCQLHGDEFQRYDLGCFSPFCGVNPHVIDITEKFCIERWNRRD